MAKCYECFDDELFKRLGPSGTYYKERENYDVDDSAPFICSKCGAEVNPHE